jgi:hypothetical protein
VQGKAPEWETDLGIVRVEKSVANAWTVDVADSGTKLERYIKSRNDLFALYERVPPARRNG